MINMVKKIVCVLLLLAISIPLIGCTEKGKESCLIGLEAAYQLQLLSADDLSTISQGKSSEKLSPLTEDKIKSTVADYESTENKKFSADDIQIIDFYGKFNGYFVVSAINLTYDYSDIETSMTIDDYIIKYKYGSNLYLWMENANKIDITVGNICGDSEQHFTTPRLINSVKELNNALDDKNIEQTSFSKYDEQFFSSNSLILFSFTSPYIPCDIRKATSIKKGTKLLVEIDYWHGQAAAYADLLVILEVNKNDIAKTKKVNCAAQYRLTSYDR